MNRQQPDDRQDVGTRVFVTFDQRLDQEPDQLGARLLDDGPNRECVSWVRRDVTWRVGREVVGVKLERFVADDGAHGVERGKDDLGRMNSQG